MFSLEFWFHCWNGETQCDSGLNRIKVCFAHLVRADAAAIQSSETLAASVMLLCQPSYMTLSHGLMRLLKLPLSCLHLN